MGPNVSPQNFLKKVTLLLRSYIALQTSYMSTLKVANTRFRNFNQVNGNLGSSITADLNPRARAVPGLIAAQQAAEQRFFTMTANQAFNVSFAYTAQEMIFNIMNGPGGDYTEVFNENALAALALNAEQTNLQNFTSSVKPITQVGGQTIVGQIGDFTSGPRRFHGDGLTPFDSYLQIDKAVQKDRALGQAPGPCGFYIHNTVTPVIGNTGLGQYALRRNDEFAQSWEVGSFGSPAINIYQSNLLPTHEVGTASLQGTALTVVSVDDPTGVAVTQITLSGAPNSSANAILAADLFKFIHTDGYSNVNEFIQYVYKDSYIPYAMRAKQKAASDGSGNVVLYLSEPICWAGGINQNINTPIVAGMRIMGTADHVAGGIIYGNSLYFAAPPLPEEWPFRSISIQDKETMLSMMLSSGALLGMNNRTTILYQLFATYLVPEYSSRVLFSKSQIAEQYS
jgi:hypothetical protein